MANRFHTTCFCHNCQRDIDSFGIATHRAMHKRKKEKVKITMANGTWEWDYREKG